MSRAASQPGSGSAAASAVPAASKPAGFKRVRPRVDWRAVWPVPLALASAALLAGGIFVGVLKMPKDDPAVPLSEAGKAFELGRFGDALEILNHDAVGMFNKGLMVPEQQLEFFTLRARSLYFGQEKLGIELESNYRRVLEAYDAAVRAGLKVTAADTGAMVSAHLFLGESEKAVRLARTLAGVDEERRLRLYRRIVERALRERASGGAKAGRGGPALELLAEMVEMPGLSLEERAWVAARQAELRLAGGFYEEASVRLLRDLNRFDALDRGSRAELMFLLGKAYVLSGKGARALEYLESAEGGLSEFDERRGEAGVLRGQVLAGQGDTEGAREQFERVVTRFGDSGQQLSALVGLGDAEGALGNTPASLKAFGDALGLVGEHGAATGVTYQGLGERLLGKAQDRLLLGEPGEALKYAQLSQEAFRRGGRVPAGVNMALAIASRASAERIIAEAGGGGGGGGVGGRVDWGVISDISATEAKGYLIDAAINFRQHARMMTIEDYQAQMDSLWNAGEAFDRAGDTEGAIEAFSTFVQGARADFPRRAEAVFRLAQVYESRGEFGTASRLYEQLVGQRESREGFAGVWADRSLVPLARCYIQGVDDGEETAGAGAGAGGAKGEGAKERGAKESGAKEAAAPASKDGAKVAAAGARAAKIEESQKRAVALLSGVVDGGALLEPDAADFNEALTLLGELHHQRGEYEQAVARLRQSLQRDPDGVRSTMVRYKLADSHRRLAVGMASGSSDEPLSQRAASEATRVSHLDAAERLYRQVAGDIAKKPAARVSRVEGLVRRNSLLYAADCVYLSGRYAEAVRHYLSVRDQYPQDPASMVAMTQTVSALVKLERWDEARTVHERARALLASIPDEVWNDPSRLMPMERRHWESWLASKLQIEGRGPAGDGGVAGVPAGQRGEP